MKKNRLKFLLITLAMVSLLASCKDDAVKPTGPQEITMSSDLSGSEFVLTQANADKPFTTLSWSAANFGSKAVNYSIEMDVAGNNFAKAKDILKTSDLSKTFTVAQFNAALIQVGLTPGKAAQVEFRVRAWVDYLTDPALSNTQSLKTTPYKLEFPPIYLIGDAQGWSLTNALMLTSDAPGIYKGTGTFQSNGKFRLFALADWTSQQWGWSYFTGGSIPSQLGDGQDGDSNFLFGGASGSYNITIDLTGKKITIETAGPPPPAPPPTSIFIVDGDLVNISDAIELKGTSTAWVYESIVMMNQNSKFRLFDAKKWDAVKWNAKSFDAASIDTDLQDSGDDVSNFQFVSASGYYRITVSIKDKTIVVEPSSAPKQTLYIIGDAQGWNLGNALQLKSLGSNKFETTGTFQNDGKFRFFVTPDWSADQLKYSTFSGGTIDSDLADGADGDSNFKFVGATGVYKVTVSINDKTITVDPVSTPTLYLMGDDQSWSPANAISMTWLGGAKYQTTATFTNGSIFRFFANEDPASWDWNAEQWRYSTFATGTIDSDLADGGGSDSNFKFTGTTGTHTITVDAYALTVTVD